MSDKMQEILQERGDRYGPFSSHAALSVELHNRIWGRISNRLPMDMDKTTRDVMEEGVKMICHKLARAMNGDPLYDDTWRDIAGYATLVANHLEGEKE